MRHVLYVLVRLDMDQTQVCFEVSGCVTESSWDSLVPIIERTDALTGGVPAIVDLHFADHIDRPALEQLRRYYTWQGRQNDRPGQGIDGTITIISPNILPQCRSPDAGTSYAAFVS